MLLLFFSYTNSAKLRLELINHIQKNSFKIILDLKLTSGCKVFITYTVVSIFIRNFVYGANYIKFKYFL